MYLFVICIYVYIYTYVGVNLPAMAPKCEMVGLRPICPPRDGNDGPSVCSAGEGAAGGRAGQELLKEVALGLLVCVCVCVCCICISMYA